MDWDSWSELDRATLKESKNWFHWPYYILPAFPILVATFLGANGEALRFFPLILLCFTVLFFKTASSIFTLLKEKQGTAVITETYFFEMSKLPFEENTLRFIAYVSSTLSLIFGFVLCLISGFGLLTFGILGVGVSAAYLLGYVKLHYGINMGLAFIETFALAAAGYYSQCGSFSWNVLAMALPLGLLSGALILLGEENPPFHQGQKTLTDTLGKEAANRCFTLLFVVAYGFVVLNVLYGVSGFWCLLLLALLPLAKKEIKTQKSFFSFYLKFGLLYSFSMLLYFTF